ANRRPSRRVRRDGEPPEDSVPKARIGPQERAPVVEREGRKAAGIPGEDHTVADEQFLLTRCIDRLDELARLGIENNYIDPRLEGNHMAVRHACDARRRRMPPPHGELT